MKYCPKCRSQYTDNTLRFCLQDGSRLDEVRETEIPTVVLDETPTATRHPDPSNRYETNPDAAGRLSDNGVEKKRSMLVPVLVVSLGAIALFIAGAAATWMYLSGRKVVSGNNTIVVNTSPSEGNVNANRMPRISPPPLNNNSLTPPVTPASPPVDRGQAESEISGTIDRWNSQAEDLDLDRRNGSYAEWAARFFRYDATNKARTDDPDGDGLKNVMEYALGFGPLAPNSPATAWVRVTEDGVDYPAIQFRRRAGTSDLTTLVQVSTDLATWKDNTIGAFTTETSVSVQEDGMELTTVRSNSPMTTSPQYLRVKVSVP